MASDNFSAINLRNVDSNAGEGDQGFNRFRFRFRRNPNPNNEDLPKTLHDSPVLLRNRSHRSRFSYWSCYRFRCTGTKVFFLTFLILICGMGSDIFLTNKLTKETLGKGSETRLRSVWDDLRPGSTLRFLPKKVVDRAGFDCAQAEVRPGVREPRIAHIFEDMHPGGYTVEVTGLSPKATEKDVYDFFAFSGAIEHVEIVRSGEYACTAYVTFRDAYARGTAVLLSGASILDQQVCITSWGQYEDEFDFWNRPSTNLDDGTGSVPHRGSQSVSNVGEAVTMAQEVVSTMLSKGYVLGKDALSQARAFDESHQVSATAAAKVAELSQQIGLADKIFAGVEAVNSLNEKYHVSETTRSAVSATARRAEAAASAVVNSAYFSKGALWVSGALTRAAKAAADLGSGSVQQ